MLHGRHDRKIEGASATRHLINPMRLARVQQNNWNKRQCRQEHYRAKHALGLDPGGGTGSRKENASKQKI
jgi:hypothetical protein